MEWISRRSDITWNTYGRNSAKETRRRRHHKLVALDVTHRDVKERKKRRTLDIVLEDLCEDGEERVLEAADSRGVGLAGDAYRQAEGLKQVVVKVRLAGILEGSVLVLHFHFC